MEATVLKVLLLGAENRRWL